jgi:putative colanic acid biosysnthesis UDP-glucose lipid carrier transferase
LKTLQTSIRHTTVQKSPAGQWPDNGQNAIVRPFVATRKKYLYVKRAFDIAFALGVGILVMSWLTPLLALAIKLDSRGPVFFRQKRLGKFGKPFYCIKFRTMLQNSEADERPAEESDPRITRVGKFLRATNLDELPQIFNVVAGQMSIIGPRPHMLADCIRFSFVIPSYSFRSLVRPGITGWAQINGYHGPTRDYQSIIIRYYWDAQYVRKANAWIDLKILSSTIAHGFQNIRASITRKPKNK